jgi:hypothetical protein
MTILDRAIGYLAPHVALRRARQRAAIALLTRSYEGARLGRRTDGWIVAGTGANADYEGARLGRRTDGWVAAGTGANAEIGPARLVRLRDRSRDLVRNNPYAAKAVRRWSATWSAPASCRGRGRRRPGEVADRLWQLRRDLRCRRPHRLRRPAGADRARHGRERRGAGAAADRRLEDGLPVPLQLQLLEPDHLDTGKTAELPGGGFVLQGVEFDALGRRRAYWLFPVHPGEVAGSAGARPASRCRRSACCTSSSGCARARSAACRGSRPSSEAARSRRLRRGRAGAEEDRGLLRRLRHRRPRTRRRWGRAPSAAGQRIETFEPG